MTSLLFNPVFTVVMPMYNVEQFVATAIDSVLAQSYRYFELLCIDDGCTDNTLSVVRRYEDDRIRIIRQVNMGLSAARNTGINNSKGQFIAFLDADDFWHTDKLACHLAHMKNNPAVDVSYSASQFVNERGEPMHVGQWPKTKNINAQHIFCRNPVGNGSNAIIRRTVLKKMACREKINEKLRTTFFDEHMRQSEDIDFWLRLVIKTQCKFEGIDQALTYYRVNSGGLSANLDRQFQAWRYSVNKNFYLAPTFFSRYSSLARAYQLRYLARRAIQSRNKKDGLVLSCKAIIADARILIQEPGRTLVTLVCALLSFLPTPLYRRIEQAGMALLRKSNQIGVV